MFFMGKKMREGEKERKKIETEFRKSRKNEERKRK